MDFPEVIGRGLQGKRGKRVTCSPAATIIIYNIIPYNKKNIITISIYISFYHVMSNFLG